MYFKRLKIQDFGPIRDIEFKFEKDTVYHFVGGNDSGKSMVLDAMNILCNNIAGIHVKKYVSDYADSFFIEAEDFEGNIIQLKRGSESWYNLIRPDGTEHFYDKIGGDVPVTIANIVNTYVDDLKKEKFNFRYSDDKILFMNTTPGENYSFFQKALRTDKVLNALKHANKTQNSMDKEIDITRSKVEFERDKLDRNPDITYIKDEIDLYRNAIKDSMETARLVKSLVEDYDKIDKLEQVVLPSEVADFEWDTPKQQVGVIRKSKELVNELEKESLIVKTSKVSKDIHEMFDTISEYQVTMSRIKEFIQIKDKINRFNQKYDSVQVIKDVYEKAGNYRDELNVTRSQLDLINTYRRLKNKKDTMENMYTLISSLEKEYEEQKELNEVLIKDKELVLELDRLSEHDTKIEEHSKKIRSLEDEKIKFMRENNFCPVVVNSLDKKCPFSNKTLEQLMEGV